MSTQEFTELLAEIDTIPAVDVHSRLQADAPAASDLAAMALNDVVLGELSSANAPSEFFQTDGAKKMLQESIEYLPRINNTTTCWLLAQILGDLYDSKPFDECDLQALWQKVDSTATDAKWPESVLERSNLTKDLHCCDWHRPLPQASEKFAPIIRIDSLINEAHTSRTLDRLNEATDQPVYEIADLKKAIVELFRRAKSAGALAASVSLEPQVDFEVGNRDAGDRVLSLVLLGQKVNRDERKALRSFVIDTVLDECKEYRMPIQLLVGKRYLRSGEREIAAYEPGMVAMYADLVGRHSGVKFDFLCAHDALARELAVLSRGFRNVFLSGSWMYLAFPSRMRQAIRERVEMLPMTKCCGLASDAESVEWVYAQAKLVRRETAFALAQLVDEGYLTRGTAIDFARNYLLDNPKRIYKIE